MYDVTLRKASLTALLTTAAWRRPDEHFVVEGPWLMHRAGTYYLFYSANSYKGPEYRLNVATSSAVAGPYTKVEVPVVQTDWARYNQGVNSTFEGPGHGSVVEDEAGDWWLVYHSWRSAQSVSRHVTECHVSHVC